MKDDVHGAGWGRERRKIMLWVKEPLSWSAKNSWAKSLLCSWPFCCWQLILVSQVQTPGWPQRSRSGIQFLLTETSLFIWGFPPLSSSPASFPLLFSRKGIGSAPILQVLLSFGSLPDGETVREIEKKDVRSEVRLSVPLSPHWSRGCIPYLQLPV